MQWLDAVGFQWLAAKSLLRKGDNAVSKLHEDSGAALKAAETSDSMAYVITNLCAGVCAGACFDTCPTEAIGGTIDPALLLGGGPAADAFRASGSQLYINPDDCIDCGACAQVCPSEAIYFEDDLPEALASARGENAAFYGLKVDEPADLTGRPRAT